MEIYKAVVLGLLQGITEFLPVSSSGHLVLGQHLFGLTEPELLFDVVLHLGTLIAVIAIYHREIATLFAEFFGLPGNIKQAGSWSAAWNTRMNLRLMVLIIIGSIPTALIGFLFKDQFEVLFGSTLAVGIALLVTGGFLFLTRYINRRGHDISTCGPKDALLIGVAQGLAITPGISRSGITITTGLFLGLDRELAARFSFLLFIPAILGALLLQILDAGSGSAGLPALCAGFFSALISGLAALVLLLRLVRRGRLHYFGYYCWLVGLVTIIVSLTRVGN
jgi:undecaprenyl-diphosphatase